MHLGFEMGTADAGYAAVIANCVGSFKKPGQVNGRKKLIVSPKDGSASLTLLNIDNDRSIFGDILLAVLK